MLTVRALEIDQASNGKRVSIPFWHRNDHISKFQWDKRQAEGMFIDGSWITMAMALNRL